MVHRVALTLAAFAGIVAICHARVQGEYEEKYPGKKKTCSDANSISTKTGVEDLAACQAECDAEVKCEKIFLRESDMLCKLVSSTKCNNPNSGNFLVYTRTGAAVDTSAPTTPPECPTDEDMKECPKKLYSACTKAAGCSWCGSSDKRCVAGIKLKCTEPSVYSHCPTPAPTETPTTAAPTQGKGVWSDRLYTKKTCPVNTHQLTGNDLTLQDCKDACDDNVGFPNTGESACDMIYWRGTNPKSCNLLTVAAAVDAGCPKSNGKFDVYERIRGTFDPTAAPTTAPTTAAPTAPTTAAPTVACPADKTAWDCVASCKTWTTGQSQCEKYKGKACGCKWCSAEKSCVYGTTQACGNPGIWQSQGCESPAPTAAPTTGTPTTPAPTPNPTITLGTYVEISNKKSCKNSGDYFLKPNVGKNNLEGCSRKCDLYYKCAGFAYNSNAGYCNLIPTSKFPCTEKTATSFKIYNRTSAAPETSAPTDAPTTPAPTAKLECPSNAALKGGCDGFAYGACVGTKGKNIGCSWCGKDDKRCVMGVQEHCTVPNLYDHCTVGPTATPTANPTTPFPTTPRPPGVYEKSPTGTYRCKSSIATLAGERYETNKECEALCDALNDCFGYNWKKLETTAASSNNCRLYKAKCTKQTSSAAGWSFYQRMGDAVPTAAPTNPPTDSPTDAPTAPTTAAPTNSPTAPTTAAPTATPTTGAPTTAAPTTATDAPTDPTATDAPTDPTATDAPTDGTTGTPTKSPTKKGPVGTKSPTDKKTKAPTKKKTKAPTKAKKKKVKGKFKIKDAGKLTATEIEAVEASIKASNAICTGCDLTIEQDGDEFTFSFDSDDAEAAEKYIQDNTPAIKSTITNVASSAVPGKDLVVEELEVEEEDDDEGGSAGAVVGGIVGGLVVLGAGVFLYKRQNTGFDHAQSTSANDVDLVVKDPVKKKPVLETELVEPTV